MDMYMGTRSTYSDLLGYDFPEQIQSTTKRHQGLYDGKSSTVNANLWAYCNEDSFWFKHCTVDKGAVIAYEQEDTFFNNWYITFCPAFFDKKHSLSFSDKLKSIKASNPKIMEVINGPPGFQAGTWFHETMHMSQLVTSPHAVDYGYGSEYVYDLAKGRNTDAAVYNADSWTIAAQAIWAQAEFNLDSPPIPNKYYTGAKANDIPTDSRTSDVMYIDSGAVVPQGASPVAAGQPYNIDPSLWQVYTPGKGLASVSDTKPTSTDSSTPTSSAAVSSSSTAPTPPPAADICGDWYKFLFDYFEIYGKNFDPAKFGTDGSGLKKQIQGCGDLTNWSFEPRTDDPQGYQWFAKGNLPTGTKACVGRAVVSAGGASPDGCKGSG